MEQEHTALLHTLFEDVFWQFVDLVLRCAVLFRGACFVYFMSGGDSYGGETGFLGCMRNLYVQGFRVVHERVLENVGNVINGSCDLQDRFAVFYVCFTVAFVLITSAVIAKSGRNLCSEGRLTNSCL